MSSKSFARDIFWVHLFPPISDSQSSGFYKASPLFQNICPAISMQLLVCNLQLFSADSASRPGVTNAFESCWESCCSLTPCFHQRGAGICIQEAQPCQVTHWQEQGVNPTCPILQPVLELQKSGPGRGAAFPFLQALAKCRYLSDFKSRRDHCELLTQKRQAHFLGKCHLSTASLRQSPAQYHCTTN